ncbi:MAG: hypothetical protein L0Z50_12925 [Verrucomicrobiales bacterium]|nr:hypothetical protein [Verrucomicrobiales bacterium]
MSYYLVSQFFPFRTPASAESLDLFLLLQPGQESPDQIQYSRPTASSAFYALPGRGIELAIKVK